jgi:hypothetical protein
MKSRPLPDRRTRDLQAFGIAPTLGRNCDRAEGLRIEGNKPNGARRSDMVGNLSARGHRHGDIPSAAANVAPAGSENYNIASL